TIIKHAQQRTEFMWQIQNRMTHVPHAGLARVRMRAGLFKREPATGLGVHPVAIVGHAVKVLTFSTDDAPERALGAELAPRTDERVMPGVLRELVFQPGLL